MRGELELVVNKLVARVILVLYSEDVSLIPITSPFYIFKGTERWPLAAELADVSYLLLTSTYDLALRVLLYRVLKLPVITSNVAVKDILKSIRRRDLSISSLTYNIKSFNERPAA
jgi:hypothetical protein